MGIELSHVGSWMDMMKITIAFLDFANALRNPVGFCHCRGKL